MNLAPYLPIGESREYDGVLFLAVQMQGCKSCHFLRENCDSALDALGSCVGGQRSDGMSVVFMSENDYIVKRLKGEL